MEWSIVYLSEVQSWLDNIDNQQLKSVAKELRLLELCGNTLRLPHSRSLGDSLLELRERKFGFRVYYTFDKLRTVVILHAGDKNSQPKDIKIARQRLKDFKGAS